MPDADAVLTLGQKLMVAVYWLLVTFWLIVLVSAASYLKFHAPPLLARQYKQVRATSLIVASILFVDSLYWAITNTARVGVIDKAVELKFRDPELVALVKFLVLLSALSFFVIIVRATQSLRKEYEERFFSTFIEQTWDAVGILDEQGRMRLWNTGAENLFGFRREDVIGKHIKEFLVPEDLWGEIDQHLEMIKKTRQAAQHYHSYRLTARGDRIPIDLTISPILDPQFRGYFGIMRAAVPHRHFINFGDAHRQRSEKFAFVAMPYAPEVVPDEVYTDAIKGAVTANELQAVRADEDIRAGRIIDQLFHDIRQSVLVVADITGGSPNVFYEIGLAHVLNKTVILLVNKDSAIPFDILAFRVIKYDVTKMEALRDALGSAIREHLHEHRRVSG